MPRAASTNLRRATQPDTVQPQLPGPRCHVWTYRPLCKCYWCFQRLTFKCSSLAPTYKLTKTALMGSAPGLSVPNRTMLWAPATFTPASHNSPDSTLCAGEDHALPRPRQASCPPARAPLSALCTAHLQPGSRELTGLPRHPTRYLPPAREYWGFLPLGGCG